MSGESVKYFVRRDPDGTVSHLVRIRELPDAGLWGEFFRDGQWHESAAVMDYLLDPLLGDRISEQEATAWLERHAVPAGADAPRILASLYAQLEGRDPAEAPRLTTLGE